VKGLPVKDAARVLNVPPGTLRRWVRSGCPVVARGRRGRGCALLIDPAEAMAWHRSSPAEAAILALADKVPDLLAGAIQTAWQSSSGIDKKRLAGILAATWYAGTTTTLDHLRESCPEVPELTRLPEQIEVLRKIAQ
jgi:phage terminase Nu1 subunit (DNA packaging protein)